MEDMGAWEEHIDDASGQPFYSHRVTGETRWDKPSSADAHSVSWSPKMVVNDAFVASIDRCVSGAIFRL